MRTRSPSTPPTGCGAAAPRSREAGDLLGAHVSIAGGIHLAPARARAIGATAMQVFTKTPNQWRDPPLPGDRVAAFRQALAANRIACAVAHDSYLINLASPRPGLRRRSVRAFIRELERCAELGIPWLVSHPGNHLDGLDRGLARNAAGYTSALREGPSTVTVLLETTAGTGTALGSTFEELAALRDRIGGDVRDRVGFCVDTCHVHAAGYDLRSRYDEVWAAWDRAIGLEAIGCLHLNDSKTPCGARRDRHALIGEGALGPEPFRRVMRDPRFAAVPKILETPKGDGSNDRRMLRRLRGYARRRAG